MAQVGGSYLHFTLGPVQSFVAQARRTRDLWAGSFLLSYLTGQAMAAVLRSGGRIVFPEVARDGEPIDPLLKAIMNGGQGPDFGSLPNRFKAEITNGFSPEQCREAVATAWDRVAQVVWDEFVAPSVSYGKGTEAIWQRQIKNFWEVAWCIGEENNLLDRRKNWRSGHATVEPGDKCTMMGTLEEVSGYTRSIGREAEQQRCFWENIRRCRGVGKLNLRDNERLCAIALIKRLFPLTGDSIGWRMRPHFPSTAYVAAVPWLVAALTNKPKLALQYGEASKGIADQNSRMAIEQFRSIKEAVGHDQDKRGFASLGGEYFHQAALKDGDRWEESTSVAREQLRALLSEDKLGEPTSFFAMLLMDGDRLGKLLQGHDSTQISQGLARFTGQAQDIFERHDGVVIYAGGDDVLGLFPVSEAIGAALDLRRVYEESFTDTTAAGQATISAAIVYAHYNHPLQAMVAKSHDLLDRVAKEGTGRSSLAVTVWKGSGPTLEWSMPWECLTEGAPADANLVDELVTAFRNDDSEPGGQYSSRFFYHIQERFPLFADREYDEDVPVRLLVAEYLKNKEGRQVTIEEAQDRVSRLIRMCRKVKRDAVGKVEFCGKITIDGALLVRFLAMGGKAG
jgi:CRISPR-associated protein Cmr2